MAGFVVVAVLVLGWLAYLRLFPRRDCRWCGGSGEWRRGKSVGDCRRCRGDGTVRKFGTRLVGRRDA